MPSTPRIIARYHRTVFWKFSCWVLPSLVVTVFCAWSVALWAWTWDLLELIGRNKMPLSRLRLRCSLLYAFLFRHTLAMMQSNRDVLLPVDKTSLRRGRKSIDMSLWTHALPMARPCTSAKEIRLTQPQKYADRFIPLAEERGVALEPDWRGLDPIWPLVEEIRENEHVFFVKVDGERRGGSGEPQYTCIVSGGANAHFSFRADVDCLEERVAKVLVEYFENRRGVN